MDANDRGADRLNVALMRCNDDVHQAVPDASFPLSVEAVKRGPQRSGASAQGEPERRTKKMPFKTRRSSTRFTPRTLLERCGSIAFHSASVKSIIASHRTSPASELESQRARVRNAGRQFYVFTAVPAKLRLSQLDGGPSTRGRLGRRHRNLQPRYDE
jgi:hypothetical protein